jgi:gluconolactonase
MVEAKDERFWRCVDRNAKVARVAEGLQDADGPVFSRIGYLLFSERGANRIQRWESGKMSVYRDKMNEPGRLTFDHQGRLLACEKNRVIRIEKNGSVTVLAEGLQSARDVVYAIDGSVYCVDSGAKRLLQVTRERGGVGGSAGRGSVRQVAGDCPTPDGVALSATQQQLYVSDLSGVVRVYSIGPDGSLSGGREFARLKCGAMKTDEAGNVWVTEEKGIAILDAKGVLLGRIETPEPPTAFHWGNGFRGLFITSKTALWQMPTRTNGTRTY